MIYDIGTKVLLEKCRDEILHWFLGLAVTESTLLEEVPQETASLRRADFAVRILGEDGISRMVLLEIQSRWDDAIPLRLLEYRTRYLLKYGLETLSSVLLLRPSGKALDFYQDHEVSYRFRLLALYAMPAQDVLDRGSPCLLPFVPLMRGGQDLAREAEERLTRSPLPPGDKGDILSSMALLSGLVSKKLATELIQRRRDLMIESPAYEIFRKDGMEEGLQQGLQQGKKQEAREAILDYLEERFGRIPPAMVQAVDAIDDLRHLKSLRRKTATVPSLDAFAALLESSTQESGD